MINNSQLLSVEFGRAVEPAFFRPLAGESRGVVIDLLDRLADGFTQGRRSIPRSEAVDLLREALVTHPTFVAVPASESATAWADPGHRANYYFNLFTEAGWVLEDAYRYNLRKRTVVLDSNAQALLALVKELAQTSFHGASRFSDTFRSVLDAVLAPQRAVLGPDDECPYATLRDLTERCSKGMIVLRRIETILRRFTREQAETDSRRRNLELVVVELQTLTRTQYFRELNNPLLFRRCDDAADRLEKLTYDHELLRRMTQECVEREEAKSEVEAELLVLQQLRSLADTLKGLRGEAAQIEGWATRFLSASLAKFRHLQSIPSRQVETAKARLAEIARELAGRRWWIHLPEEMAPRSRLPGLSFMWGISSLWRPPETNADTAPAPVRRPSREGSARAITQLKEVRRKSITLRRANVFVEKILPKKGDKIDSERLVIRNLETLIDVLSCLCYAQSRRANFRIFRPVKHRPRGYAKTGDWYLEAFTLERTQ